MRFGLLGGLSVRDGSGSHLPTAPKQRQLLALLLLHAGHVVPVRVCIAEIWGEDPPASAGTTLQTYVMHLRRLLARLPSVGSREAAHERLRMRPPGYVLHVRPQELDLLRFEELVASAGKLPESRVAARSRLLREALGLWSRPMLADVRTGSVLRPAVTHWEQRRLAVHEDYLDTRLRLGQPRDVLPDLAVLTRLHPTHELLHARYMSALYAVGRTGDALAAGDRLTAALAEDLGVAPGSAVRRLRDTIRAGGPAPDPTVLLRPIPAL
ncbi:AfsR/SARP family transcriptional regulator [Streptomyces xanthophaeus]|uniref:AfsR/SARP family transcriptional regulator n=1 Tax=Streptomyces xanthophaeus TaxID=67385 RepID=UPI0026477CF9|nr:AfsR/SARP family transcriptional regulator [Streptomyces xanthophaeus]WKD32288.1 AfsR/SARP family transcriptional regulator [Streptomyces xanthophaeus]